MRKPKNHGHRPWARCPKSCPSVRSRLVLSTAHAPRLALTEEGEEAGLVLAPVIRQAKRFARTAELDLVVFANARKLVAVASKRVHKSLDLVRLCTAASG